MLSLWDNSKTYLSVLSVYELYAGMKSKEKEATDNFINDCFIEVVTPEIAEKGGELFRNYRANGITLTSIDCLIMSIAIIIFHSCQSIIKKTNALKLIFL